MIMTIEEKLKSEENNLLNIFIYANKGVFAYAYERSAYALIKSVKAFQVKVQYNRQLKMNYLSVGVNAKSITRYFEDKYKLTEEKFENEENLTVFKVELPLPLFSEEEFQKWKKETVSRLTKENFQSYNHIPTMEQTDHNSFYKSVIDDIMSQQLSNYTPMMAMTYLNELQQKIRNGRG